ncbi:potassium channel family protein [Roseomonas sp. NAR14]|uniref:Potassium channel family protein n=1 Tax=Roseomonas acroporae TaxID=2937791 RepID=A0A9X2BVP6_9PROT|nr:potassium channel family protein [Roseomonas acroporae]MCK8782970.1 potassium channel family protein [Roseomonas acroporae]
MPATMPPTPPAPDTPAPPAVHAPPRRRLAGIPVAARLPPAEDCPAPFPPGLRRTLHELYFRPTPRAERFRYALLGLDLATVVFIAATSFVRRGPAVEVLDVLFGLVLLAELAARLLASPRPLREAVRPVMLADMVAVASFLVPLAGEGVAFLRALRVLRLLRTYRLLECLRRDFPAFARNEESITATADLLVFIFIMTGLVYETQHRHNPQIGNYADSLYFTITALTTTGFGDITLPGTTGRLLAVVIMFCGVTLFLRLAQSMFRPHKVRFPCPRCGLQRHEPDAVHCKACGRILNIPDEGE